MNGHSENEESLGTTVVHLRKVTGNLFIGGQSDTDTYEVYFHIPIRLPEQIPILIEVESPDLIDWRFIRHNSVNTLAVARMRKGHNSPLNWTAWVLVKDNYYANRPWNNPLPSKDHLPDSVKQWLVQTDCVQLDPDIVQETAQTVRAGATDVIALANNICEFCAKISFTFPLAHYPASFDAFYALTWGGSCTHRAHAAAALFRANGIPARVLLNIPTWSNALDMHWIVEYYLPEYGWIRMEPSTGEHPCFARDEIVTYLCYPENEFPVYYPWGLNVAFHTSFDKIIQWKGAHLAEEILTLYDNNDHYNLKWGYALADSVFNFYNEFWGLHWYPAQQTLMDSALYHQSRALTSFQANNIPGFNRHIEKALRFYKYMDPHSEETLFYEDFEGGPGQWTHDGIQTKWECGSPTYGPDTPHSGTVCFGTNLDGPYENNSDAWILSPQIPLTDLSSAFLSFWVWNWVEEDGLGNVLDPLTVEVTTDGVEYRSLSGPLGGVNDDPEIPVVGGWSQVHLDLFDYIGQVVQFRFRFQSDSTNVQPGSYIDDVHVYGRAMSLTGINNDHDKKQIRSFQLHQNFPNPFNPTTTIHFTLKQTENVRVEIFSNLGKSVSILIDKELATGEYSIPFNASDLPSGVYFFRLSTDTFQASKKMLLMK